MPGSTAGAFTVLVVDADDVARETYKRSLTAAGLTVHEAGDGREALVQIHALKPHAVVLDARLPYINGLQLCSLLKNDAETAGLRIVAIATDGAEEQQRFHERGADAVFMKPVPVDVLTSTVRGNPISSASPDRSVAVAAARPLTKAKAHERYVTTHPPLSPPQTRCPQCDGSLHYSHSHVGGVSERHAEQWDYFVCTTHGTFQYRHRTRRLRQVP
ncbi:MAG: response regulator [Vicinamibacterales bacterium]